MAEQEPTNEQEKTGHGLHGNQEPPGTREAARGFLKQLFDLQMREIVTTRMLPIIYALALAGAGLLSLYSIAWGFSQSWWAGVAWLIVIGPALFLAVVTTVRVLLEFVMTVFRIACYMEVLGNQIEGLSGQMEEIEEDLPRIQFWRSWTRKK